MKRFIAFGVSVFLVGAASLALAQSTGSGTTTTQVVGKGSNIHNLSTRLKQDMVQIQKDLKSGKLTAAQAKSLRDQIKGVRQQQLADMKANGTKTLTDAQVAQLNSQLDTIEKSL